MTTAAIDTIHEHDDSHDDDDEANNRASNGANGYYSEDTGTGTDPSAAQKTTNNNNKMSSAKKRLATLLKKAAAQAIAEGDPWAKYNMEKIPAERVIRHLYHAPTKSWTSDETIVKMEKEPFTHGAMRWCYRLKKRSTLPASASNHRFHDYGWTRASNYVAKAYQKDNKMEIIDTSEDAKEAVRNDIMLQYEAAYWAEKFNTKHPPKQLVFIRAYALEFPDRPGRPWFAVERYIFGTDDYNCGFTKHNTNSGFVDTDILHRVTPQVFSAYSFYASHGDRLVADIQGVGDLYTDPQVLSSDYRFGDGDLGPRGMALFFHSFRYNTLANSLGIPVFALSKNELKHQAKFEDDDENSDDLSLSTADSSYKEALRHLDRFGALDLNRSRRSNILSMPPAQLLLGVPDEARRTEKRSNMTPIITAASTTGISPTNSPVPSREAVRTSLKKSMISIGGSAALRSRPKFARKKSDVDEVQQCLDLAKRDFEFDNRAYHRMASGEMPSKKKSSNHEQRGFVKRRPSLLIRTVSEPIAVNPTTRHNLGKVHYQLAVLHGMGRFPEIVPKSSMDDSDEHAEKPSHDVFSVLFHLAHAASMRNVAACLALGRVHAGLGTCVSNLLETIVPVDFDTAKDLLSRAMRSEHPPASTKAAAGCLLYQIHMDEQEASSEDIDGFEQGDMASDVTIMHLLQDVLRLMGESEVEKNELDKHKKKKKVGGGIQYQVGDKVEGNYFLEGNYYPGIVDSISDDGQVIVVKYDDDGSTESLSLEHVRLIVPPTATQTALGGPLSDEEAFGTGNTDEKCFVEACQLRVELAALKEKAGNKEEAAALYEEASNEAMASNKMKKATEWSLKAASLME